MTTPIYFTYTTQYFDDHNFQYNIQMAGDLGSTVGIGASGSSTIDVSMYADEVDAVTQDSASYRSYAVSTSNTYFGSSLFNDGGVMRSDVPNYLTVNAKQTHSSNLDNFSSISMASDIKTNILQAASLAAMAGNIAAPISTALALDGAAFKPVAFFAPAFTGTSTQYIRGDGTYATTPAAQIQSDWNQASSGSLDFIKNKPTIPSVIRTTSTLSLSLVATGATGTQISATKDSSVKLTASTSTTSTIGGPSTSLVALKICSTNNATEASWTTVATLENDQTITLAIVLNSIQVLKGQLSADVPAGWYVKLVNSGTGTHSESFVSGQQTIYG